MYQMSCAKPPPPLNVNLMLSITLTYFLIYLFSFLQTGTVQFCGCLVRQYMACLMGWELRVLYHCTMCTSPPNLISLDFYAIPIFPFTFTCLLSFELITIPNLLIGASIQQCHEQQKNTTSQVVWTICVHVRREMHVCTG